MDCNRRALHLIGLHLPHVAKNSDIYSPRFTQLKLHVLVVKAVLRRIRVEQHWQHVLLVKMEFPD